MNEAVEGWTAPKLCVQHMLSVALPLSNCSLSCLAPACLQHMAAVRQVFNPIEKDDVIGITNYIDVGLQLHVPLTADGGPAAAAAAGGKGAAAATGSSSSSSSEEVSGTAGLRLAGAWQVGAWFVNRQGSFCC
jgi:hypothetical protein